MKRGGGLFIASLVCLALAAVLRFCFVGYGFSALCMCGLSLALAFYGCMAGWNTRAAKILSVLGAALLSAGLVLFSLAEVPVWRDSVSDENTDAPYIIVFGAAVHGTVPSLSLTERMEAALSWLAAHPDAVAILSGGQGGGEEIPEAEAMYIWLTEHGVAPDRLLTETLSSNSYENLLFSLRVIEDHGGDPGGRVALCSSEYHLYRLRLIAETLGCEPVGVAAKTGYFFLRLNYAVREAFAVWRIWLLGPGLV